MSGMKIRPLILSAVAFLSFAVAAAAEPEWKLVWADEFNGSRINSRYWTKIERGKPDWKSKMSDDPSLYAVKNGKLILRGKVNTNRKKDPLPFITGVVEVFLDTFVICTITGLTLGVTGVLDSGVDGSVLAIYAFGSVWPPLRYVVSVCLLMFCFTTLMSQWYFGFVGLNYIFGVKAAEKFKYVFPCFCVIGALTELELVWTIKDIALGLLTLPNLVALVFLAPQVRRATKEFFNEI